MLGCLLGLQAAFFIQSNACFLRYLLLLTIQQYEAYIH
jgi:hypothetical protein